MLLTKQKWKKKTDYNKNLWDVVKAIFVEKFIELSD